MTITAAQIATIKAGVAQALADTQAPGDASTAALAATLATATTEAAALVPTPVVAKPPAPVIKLSGSVVSVAIPPANPAVAGFDVYIGGVKAVSSNWKVGLPTVINLAVAPSTSAWLGTLPIPAPGVSETVTVTVYNGQGESPQSNAVVYTTPSVTPPTPPSPPTGTVGLGVYVGGINPSGAKAFESLIGAKSLAFVNEYMPGTSWGTISGAGGQDDWLFPTGWGNPAPFPMMIGVPILLSGATYAQGAAGAYNSNFVTLAQYLVANGQADAMLRLGWEFNGTWYSWSVYTGTWEGDTNAPLFVSYWQEIVTSMRSVPGQNFKFIWNPTLGDQGDGNMQLYLPANEYVDMIGLDFYDSAWGSYPGWQAAFDSDETNAYALDYYAALSKSTGLPLIFPEWGLGQGGVSAPNSGPVSAPNQQTGGGDNPHFIELSVAWFEANNVVAAGYWDYNTWGVVGSGENPLTEAALQAAFG